MKVYIDTSALNRIFDDQSQPRIYLEASSMLIVFMLIDFETIEFVSSDVLLFENVSNPYEERRVFINLCIQKAKHIQPINEGILTRAQEIKADYFLTCDDKISKRYNGSIKVQNPTNFVINFFKKEESNDS